MCLCFSFMLCCLVFVFWHVVVAVIVCCDAIVIVCLQMLCVRLARQHWMWLELAVVSLDQPSKL